MIDLKQLRESPDLFRSSQKVRGEDVGVIDQLLAADEERSLKLCAQNKTPYLNRWEQLMGMRKIHC
jgi:seryl-tRNA synthetase